MSSPVVLSLPFTGRWLVQNSPAGRVPSHGIDLLGQRYAIDFVGVDGRTRTAPVRDWRTFLATEPPERFFAFGRPVLAPVAGIVRRVHDGEADHAARRSQVMLVAYLAGQSSRLRQGPAALAGNHLVIEDRRGGAFVALVHLRRGSMRVGPGDEVVIGQQVGECGNSGNSTQPHVHVQAMDHVDVESARGLPIEFRAYRESARTGAVPTDRKVGIPADGAVVEPLRADLSAR